MTKEGEEGNAPALELLQLPYAVSPLGKEDKPGKYRRKRRKIDGYDNVSANEKKSRRPRCTARQGDVKVRTWWGSKKAEVFAIQNEQRWCANDREHSGVLRKKRWVRQKDLVTGRIDWGRY